MRRTSATQRRPLEITGRPEGGAGGTGPLVVPPASPRYATSDVAVTRRNAAIPLPGDLPLLLIDAMQLAQVLGIGRTKAFQLISRGEVPVVRIGRCARVPLGELQEWIASRAHNVDSTMWRR